MSYRDTRSASFCYRLDFAVDYFAVAAFCAPAVLVAYDAPPLAFCVALLVAVVAYALQLLAHDGVQLLESPGDERPENHAEWDGGDIAGRDVVEEWWQYYYWLDQGSTNSATTQRR